MSAEIVPAGVPFYFLLGPEAEEIKSGQHVAGYVEQFRKLLPLGLETVKRLFRGDIPDPTVGENACQLRAWKFAEFVNAPDFTEVAERSYGVLASAREKIERVPAPPKRENISLACFLEKVDCRVVLDHRVHLLVSAHLLTLAREPVRSFQKVEDSVQPCEEVRQISGLKEYLGSPTACKRVESVAKKALAEASVRFLQDAAKEEERLFSLVSGKNVLVTQLGLSTAPCFSGAEILLASARKERTPLVVRIHQVDAKTTQEEGVVTFFYTSDGLHYRPSDREQACRAKAWIGADALSVAHPVLSSAELTEEMGRREVTETLLAFMATHPVYGGDLKTREGPPEEAARREAYAQSAHEWGCSPKNPRVCRFYHMYPVTAAAFDREEG